jgi:hypothetical protein
LAEVLNVGWSVKAHALEVALLAASSAPPVEEDWTEDVIADDDVTSPELVETT